MCKEVQTGVSYRWLPDRLPSCGETVSRISKLPNLGLIRMKLGPHSDFQIMGLICPGQFFQVRSGPLAFESSYWSCLVGRKCHLSPSTAAIAIQRQRTALLHTYNLPRKHLNLSGLSSFHPHRPSAINHFIRRTSVCFLDLNTAFSFPASNISASAAHVFYVATPTQLRGFTAST